MSRGLTAPELERAVVALYRLRALRKGSWELRHIRKTLLTKVRPLRATLNQLTILGLLAHDDRDVWTLTAVGERILDAQDEKNWRPLTAMVMSSGGVEDDILAFLQEAQKVDECAVLRAARARTVCPTLAAVMGWVPEWRDGDRLVVPLEALQTAMAAAALELTEDRPQWVEEQEQIGRRAEAYSLRHEREHHGAESVLYISRDVGDQYGYDLENRKAVPARLIECKGSRSTNLTFVITAHELDKAQQEPAGYEIQFWGGIDLARSPHEEYETLIKKGYPTVVIDPAARIADGRLVYNCVAWQVRDADG